jgi:hypothetical protein
MSRQKISLNTLSGPDSRDLSVRDPAGRIRVSAWSCQTLSKVPACYLGITRGRVRTSYLPVLPLYGFTKLYTNPFLIIYLLPNFKLPVLVLTWGLEQKKLNPCSHTLACPVVALRLWMERTLERVRYAMDSGDKDIRLLGGFGPPLSHASTSVLGGGLMQEKVNGCNSIPFPMVALITPSLLFCSAYPGKIIDKTL